MIIQKCFYKKRILFNSLYSGKFVDIIQNPGKSKKIYHYFGIFQNDDLYAVSTPIPSLNVKIYNVLDNEILTEIDLSTETFNTDYSDFVFNSEIFGEIGDLRIEITVNTPTEKDSINDDLQIAIGFDCQYQVVQNIPMFNLSYKQEENIGYYTFYQPLYTKTKGPHIFNLQRKFINRAFNKNGVCCVNEIERYDKYINNGDLIFDCNGFLIKKFNVSFRNIVKANDMGYYCLIGFERKETLKDLNILKTNQVIPHGYFNYKPTSFQDYKSTTEGRDCFGIYVCWVPSKAKYQIWLRINNLIQSNNSFQIRTYLLYEVSENEAIEDFMFVNQEGEQCIFFGGNCLLNEFDMKDDDPGKNHLGFNFNKKISAPGIFNDLTLYRPIIFRCGPTITSYNKTVINSYEFIDVRTCVERYTYYKEIDSGFNLGNF